MLGMSEYLVGGLTARRLWKEVRLGIDENVKRESALSVNQGKTTGSCTPVGIWLIFTGRLHLLRDKDLNVTCAAAPFDYFET